MAAKVEIYDELEAVAHDAAGALDRPAQPSLFDRLDWYRLVAAHCPPPGRLQVVRGRDGGAAAWLFLAADGARAQGFTNWYSLRFGASQAGAAAHTLQAMAKALRGRLAQVELYPIAADDPLPEAFRTAGWIVDRTRASSSWRTRTEGLSFEQYWASRPARLRNTARRKAAAADLDMAIHRAFEPAAWADYEAVYAASWKPQEGSPCFMRALAEQEGAAGALRLGIASQDGRPIAAQLWLVEHGVATIHKLAYAEHAKSLSPGTILSAAMFREAIDVDRVRLIDFGTGDDAYKAEWMEEKAPLYRLIAYNPSRPAGLAGAARAAAAKLVGRLRSD